MAVTPTSSRARVTGFVFFAVNRERGLVRLGYSTEPHATFRKLQTVNSEALTLSLVLPGTEHTYQALVNKLAGCHFRNGWYDTAKVAGILLGLDIREGASS